MAKKETKKVSIKYFILLWRGRCSDQNDCNACIDFANCKLIFDNLIKTLPANLELKIL